MKRRIKNCFQIKRQDKNHSFGPLEAQVTEGQFPIVKIYTSTTISSNLLLYMLITHQYDQETKISQHWKVEKDLELAHINLSNSAITLVNGYKLRINFGEEITRRISKS